VWLVVLAAITAARIALVESLPDQGYFAKYTIFADRIIAGDLPSERLLDLSPLYLWFTVALRAAGAGFEFIRGFQIALVSFAALFAAIAARRSGRIASIAAAAFVVASRGALVCATELEPESLILMLNAAALAAVMNARPVTGGFILGLSAICRPSALLAAFAIAIVTRSWRLLAATAAPVAIILVINAALTGEIAVMDPGTVFYEGMNPSASGFAGVQPRIVNDLERQSREPDFLHVAYRLVASRAEGRMLSRTESNRYWTSKAIAFARDYPRAAAALTLRKLRYAFHSYEPYDLVTMARKDRMLSRLPIFLPFAFILGLALAGSRVRGTSPALAMAIAVLATLVVFYVTARQRNAMIPAVAVLAGIGLAALLARPRVLYASMVAIFAIALSLNGHAQDEDRAGWFGLRNAFDRAIELQKLGKWAESDAILAHMEDYRPIRENRAVPSVAYYRARAAGHLGKDPWPFLWRASAEAPGNEHVLGLRAALGDRESRALLNELHDPFTARAALAQ
jgi:hypothetical protein